MCAPVLRPKGFWLSGGAMSDCFSLPNREAATPLFGRGDYTVRGIPIRALRTTEGG